LNPRASRSLASKSSSTPKPLSTTRKRKSTFADSILSSVNPDTETPHANNIIKEQVVVSSPPNKKMKYAMAASAAVAAAAGTCVYFTSHPTQIPWDIVQKNVEGMLQTFHELYHSVINH